VSTQYQLTQALAALHAGARRLREEDPDIAIDIADDLAEEAAAVEGAIVAVCQAAREADALSAAAKKMAQETAQRAKRFETRSQQLRGIAFSALDVLGKKKIEAASLTVSLRAGSASVLVTDASKVPAEYRRYSLEKLREMELELSLSALADDLKEGVVIEGAELSNGLTSIMIKGT